MPSDLHEYIRRHFSSRLEKLLKTFVIPIIDDGLVERTETINLILSGPGAGAFEGSPFTSTITILDDDKPLIAIGGRLHQEPQRWIQCC